jgi:hypothetical protein
MIKNTRRLTPQPCAACAAQAAATMRSNKRSNLRTVSRSPLNTPQILIRAEWPPCDGSYCLLVCAF